MKSAQACCTDGMAYALKKAGATDGLVYKFLADDANFYGFGARCLMTTDEELDTKYPNTSTAAVVADVRNGCLCRGRQWFEAMLAPFKDVYKALPEFANEKFYYTYTDGLQRLLYLFRGSRKCKGRLRHNTCGIFAQIGDQCSKFHTITWSGRPFSKWPLSAFAFPAVAAAPPGPRKHSPRFAGASCLHQGNICAGDLRQE